MSQVLTSSFRRTSHRSSRGSSRRTSQREDRDEPRGPPIDTRYIIQNWYYKFSIVIILIKKKFLSISEYLIIGMISKCVFFKQI